MKVLQAPGFRAGAGREPGVRGVSRNETPVGRVPLGFYEEVCSRTFERSLQCTAVDLCLRLSLTFVLQMMEMRPPFTDSQHCPPRFHVPRR